MSVKRGLRGVVASESELSLVVGEEGKLYYRGYGIDDLALHSTYEESLYLLWNGELPTEEELERFSEELRDKRVVPEYLAKVIGSLPEESDPMDVLRTGVSAIGGGDPQKEGEGREVRLRRAKRLVAIMPTILTTFQNLRDGKEATPPRPDLGHAENFLYMLWGEEPTEREAKAMDLALVLHLEHGLNASTFAARVTASTLSDVYSATTSAIGTLKGPLHGGANQAVIRMLKEIGEPEKAADHIRDMLSKKMRVPGFGHRVYKTMDPRAVHLKRMAKELGEERGETEWTEMQSIIEETMLEELGPKIAPNVDFYSATVYHLLKIPKDLFTPIFALSRIGGWTAHVLEQYEDNEIIRPRALYVGEKDRAYTPIEER